MGGGSSQSAAGGAKLDLASTVSEVSAFGDRHVDRLLVDDLVGTAVATTPDTKLDIIMRPGEQGAEHPLG
jgi:hypothetical protein